MKEIQLTKGYIAFVDDEDYARVHAFKWRARIDFRKDGSIRNVYAERWSGKSGSNPRTLRIHMHRFVLNITNQKIDVDHRNGNGLDNRKRNLRRASRSNNLANRRRDITNTSGFKGVTWDNDQLLWRARIMVRGKCKHLGRFYTAKKAAHAYDVAALKYFGKFALTNKHIQRRVP